MTKRETKERPLAAYVAAAMSWNLAQASRWLDSHKDQVEAIKAAVDKPPCATAIAGIVNDAYDKEHPQQEPKPAAKPETKLEGENASVLHTKPQAGDKPSK